MLVSIHNMDVSHIYSCDKPIRLMLKRDRCDKPIRDRYMAQPKDNTKGGDPTGTNKRGLELKEYIKVVNQRIIPRG